MNGMSVLVAGGGVGGMTAALLLARTGTPVTLLERAVEPAAAGAGILLQPNGLAVLHGLGLGERLEGLGHRGWGGALRSPDGRVISPLAVPPDGSGFDHLLGLRRSALLEVLLDAVAREPGIELRTGAEVVAARPDGSVELRDGGRVEADVVVGADGVRSVVRAGGDFGARVRPSGATYLRALVPGEDLGLDGEYWTGLGLFGGSPMGDGSTYFYANATARPVAAAVAARDLAALRSAWAGALPVAGRALARIDAFADLLVNEVRRVDCARWTDGRLVLLGDAAHAMAPTLGQGANSAMVDAVVLATELAMGDGGALGRYEARRRPAVRRVQDRADALARLSALGHPALRRPRDAALRTVGRSRRLAASLARLVQQEEPGALHAAVAALAGPRGDRAR